MSASIAPLIIAITGTGGTLAALMIGLIAWLRADMRRQEDRLTSRITSVENQLTSRITNVETSLSEDIKELRHELKEQRQEMSAHRKETGELRERMAHLEGHLEGIREAIVARAAA